MRTKQLMLYSFILVLLFVLVGCAAPAAAPADAPGDADTSAADAPAAGDEQIELRVAWWGSQNRHDRTIKAIELFEEAYPNIDVIYEFSGWDDHWTKMATQAAGGNLPDVMQQDYARLEEWVDRGLMMPLDDYVDDGTLNFADVSEGELAGGRVDGVLYAVNLGTNSQAVLIDLDAFAEAGIDVPAQDWSWEDLERISTELHDALGIWGMGPSLNGEQFWKSLYLGHGEWSYNNEGTALGYEDDQIFIDYLHMLLRMQDAGVIPTREEEVARWTGSGVEEKPVVTNEAAMDTLWSNQIVAVQTAAGEDRNFMMHHLPRPVGGSPSNYVKPSQFFSITSQANHPKEAAMFIDFVTNSLEANDVLFAERGVPISSVVRAHLKPQLDKAQLEMFDYMDRVVADSSPIRPPDPVGHADITNNIYFPQVVDPVLYGQLSPEEGVAILREQASLILAENAE